MKELLRLVIKFDFKGILLQPTNNSFLKFFRYTIVGGIAFLIDAGVLYVLDKFVFSSYFISVAIAFVAGLTVNFIISKRIVFTEQAIVKNKEGEFLIYGLIGLIGLGITELLMYLFIDIYKIYLMSAKLIVAILVLLWNYLVRKLLLYKDRSDN